MSAKTKPLSKGEKTLMGCVPSARLNVATDPSDTNTVVIGGHTFKFLTTLIAASGSFTQVLRGSGGVSAARTRLIDAINGTANAGVIPCTTPHTVAVVADLVDTSRVRVRQASAKGGTAAAKAPASVAVSETLADAADVWDCANLNETGNAEGGRWSKAKVAITAAMVTAGRVFVEFPFTPTHFQADFLTSAGKKRLALLTNSAGSITAPSGDDAVTISGNAVKIALNGGVTPNLQATDVVSIIAFE